MANPLVARYVSSSSDLSVVHIRLSESDSNLPYHYHKEMGKEFYL